MLKQLWQWLQHLWQHLWQQGQRWIQRWIGRQPAAEPVVPRSSVPQSPPARSDAEYEALFLSLLDKPDLTSGRFKGWLISKNVTEDALIHWLHRFGDRVQENPDQHQELAQRLIHFGTIVHGPTAQVALKLGQQIYVPPPEPEASEWGVIEAVFKNEP
ncbi:hypothetical protein [Trichothermofontia sp.]